MRNKIIVTLIPGYPSDNDLVYERGEYFIVRLKSDEIELLFRSDFFNTISEKFNLFWIDYFEHEIICEEETIRGIKTLAERFAHEYTSKKELFESICKAAEIAIEKKGCFCIIL